MSIFGELIHLFNAPWPELKDLSKLKDQGEYSEETEETDGNVTKRISFTSHDGSTRIYREVTTSKSAEKWIKRSDVERKMLTAARKRDFEEAARLRDELNDLDKELKNQQTQKKLDTGKQ